MRNLVVLKALYLTQLQVILLEKFPGSQKTKEKKSNKRNILGSFDCRIIKPFVAQVNNLIRYDTSCTVKGVGSYHSSLVPSAD